MPIKMLKNKNPQCWWFRAASSNHRSILEVIWLKLLTDCIGIPQFYCTSLACASKVLRFLTNWRQKHPPAKNYASLYWDTCHIMVVWNGTHDISEVCLYYFPVDVVTTYHKFISLEQLKYILLWFWRSEVQNESKGTKIKVPAGLASSGGSRGESHCSIFLFYRLLTFLAPGSRLDSDLCFCGHIPFSSTVAKSPFACLRTLVITFRFHPDKWR